MSDIILGSASNLKWEQCEVWAKSLALSGFTGHKILCVFGDDNGMTTELSKLGIEVYRLRELQPQENICVSRFEVYFRILNAFPSKLINVIATDVTDVVFQKNPSQFLNLFGNKPFIAASSENISYKNEAWGANNLNLSFGSLAFEKMQNNSIYNAGVMAGSVDMIKELFFSIYSMCYGKQQHVTGGGGPDQAAYNVTISLQPFNNITKFIGHDEGWACQVGTVADPYKDFSHVNIDPLPSLLNDETVVTSKGVDYYIVHQYNRNPIWNKAIKRKYLNV